MLPLVRIDTRAYKALAVAAANILWHLLVETDVEWDANSGFGAVHANVYNGAVAADVAVYAAGAIAADVVASRAVGAVEVLVLKIL